MINVGNLLQKRRPWLSGGHCRIAHDSCVMVLEIEINTNAVNRAKILAPEGIFIVDLAWLVEIYKVAS